jgi:hypothetical protein
MALAVVWNLASLAMPAALFAWIIKRLLAEDVRREFLVL